MDTPGDERTTFQRLRARVTLAPDGGAVDRCNPTGDDGGSGGCSWRVHSDEQQGSHDEFRWRSNGTRENRACIRSVDPALALERMNLRRTSHIAERAMERAGRQSNTAHELRAGCTQRPTERRAACRTLQTASASGATPVAPDHTRRTSDSTGSPPILKPGPPANIRRRVSSLRKLDCLRQRPLVCS